MIKVGINGFGRIGRLFLRRALETKAKFEVTAINTSGRMEPAGWAHLFKYDSVYRTYAGEVSVQTDELIIDDHKIKLLAEPDPGQIPWGRYGVNLVVESTGVFRQADQVRLHQRDGVKWVLMTAPPKGGQVPIRLFKLSDQLGQNDLWSNASCTTNCVAPIAQIMVKELGVVKAMMTTIHAYTSDQRLLDNSHTDLRRARSAAINTIPTTTGAATASVEIVPELEGLFNGLSIRVPVATASLADFTFLVKKPTTKAAVNKLMTEASKSPLYSGILAVTKAPLVSSDIIGNSASAIVDLSLTDVVDDDLVKIVAWYDNEWGYVCRLVDQVEQVSQSGIKDET